MRERRRGWWVELYEDGFIVMAGINGMDHVFHVRDSVPFILFQPLQ
jgi:hypothetical protein